MAVEPKFENYVDVHLRTNESLVCVCVCVYVVRCWIQVGRADPWGWDGRGAQVWEYVDIQVCQVCTSVAVVCMYVWDGLREKFENYVDVQVR